MLKGDNRLSISDWVISIIGLSLLGYTTVRAATLSFTIDESSTYFAYVKATFSDILVFKKADPNNHLLNSILSRISYLCFGNSELALRLPVLLAHVLYMVFTYKIIKRLFANLVLVVAAFLILNLNPYLLDYFGLCRGYGIAIAFLSVATYYIFLYTEKGMRKHALIATIAAAFSVLANFTLLHYYMAAIAAIAIVFVIKHQGNNIALAFAKFVWPVVLISLVLCAIIINPIRILQEANLLTYGNINGFFDDTVISLVNHSLYGVRYSDAPEQQVSHLVGIIFMVLVCCFVIYLWRQKKAFFKSDFSVASMILFMAILSPIAQHHIMGTPFFIQRIGLFYTPIFLVALLAFLSLYKDGGMINYYVSSVLVIACMSLFAVHGGKSMNFTHYFDIRFNADTKRMMSLMEYEYEAYWEEDEHVQIGNYWYYTPAIRYYRDIKQMEWLKGVNRKGFDKEADYYYVRFEDQAALDTNKVEIIYKDMLSKSIFAKNKYSVEQGKDS